VFTKLGLHWVALQCGDVNNPAWLKAKFTEFRTWGVRYIKLISSPGGDGGYPVSPMGCSDASLAAALETGLKPVMRINYWQPGSNIKCY
jgi:hypothetical protein